MLDINSKNSKVVLASKFVQPFTITQLELADYQLKECLSVKTWYQEWFSKFIKFDIFWGQGQNSLPAACSLAVL